MDAWPVRTLLILVLLLHAAESTFVETYNWVSIDCGAEAYTLDTKNLINWEMDSEYIQTGSNKNVSGNADITLQMKTLRYFPEGSTNCYSFAVEGIEKYIVRARFYYGNYDGLMKPPTFDIAVNEFKWMTVDTSSSEEPIEIEGIFSPASDEMRVCLVSTTDVDVPFVSSLEIGQLSSNTYSVIDLQSAFLLQERAAFGRKEDVVYTGNYTDDIFNRIWKAKRFPNYNSISAPIQYINYIPNEPPVAAMVNAIGALNPSDSIILPLNLSDQANQSLCAMLYFVELNNSRHANDSRKFQINFAGRKSASIVDLQLGAPQLVTLYPEWVVGPTNITLSAVQGSTLPPLLNAMELYTVMQMESAPPTSEAAGVASSFLLLIICCLFNVVYLNCLKPATVT